MSADPLTVLMENPDRVARSRAHRSLAERAEARRELDIARSHYREALELDPTDEVARDAFTALQPDRPQGMFRTYFPW